MKKKLAILAVACTILLILGGISTNYLYGTQYMTSKPGYNFTVSAAVTWYDCNWSYCKKITIDHTKVQSDLTNYPVLIHCDSDSDLAAYAQDDGDDIIFVHSNNLTRYKHEIEEFNGATGELTAWVNVTSISSTEDTILWMYYGNPNCGNQENMTGTWNKNYIMVQHLEEPSGVIIDSTSNYNNGTNNGATYNSNSKIDGGYDFDGNDNITVADSSSLDITSGITLEGWVKDPPWFSNVKQKSNIKILDKKNENITIKPGEIFTVERTIKSDEKTQVVFAALHSQDVKLVDMLVNGRSVFNSFYKAGEPSRGLEYKIENVRLKLPKELQDLETISYSDSFFVEDSCEIQMIFKSEDYFVEGGNISYLVISGDGFDYECTTHYFSPYVLIDWFDPFSIFRSIFELILGKKNGEKNETTPGYVNRSFSIPDVVRRSVEKNGKARVIIELENNVDNVVEKLRGNGFNPVVEIESRGWLAGFVDQTCLDHLNSIEGIKDVHLDNSFSVLFNDSLPQIGYNKTIERYNLTGRGVKICILDTGVDKSRVNYSYGYDFVENDDIPDDDHGHGTLVASVIKNVAPDSEIIVAKVINGNGVGYESIVLKGLEWCIQQNPDIISFSIGSIGCDGFCENLVTSMCKEAWDQGIFVLAASGNDGGASIRSPACGRYVFSVGSVDSKDNISTFSNVNPTLDLLAPGEDIDAGFDGGSGTSLSVAFTAGAAALVLEKEKNNLSPSDLKNRLKNTGKPVPYKYNDILSLNISRLDVFNTVSNITFTTPFDYSGWGTCEEEEDIYEVLAVTWTNPDTYYDPDNEWNGETYAYDDNTETDATTTIPAMSWSSFLIFNLSTSQPCDSVRYYVSTKTSSAITLIDVDVSYDGSSWTDVYQGSFSKGAYVVKDLPDPPLTINRMRIRFEDTNLLSQGTVGLTEVDFGVNESAGNDPPYATNVSISADHNFTLDDLVGSYDYNDNDSDAESGSSYEWWTNESGSWQPLGVNSTTLDSNLTNESSWYKFEVTPRDNQGNVGDPVNSSAFQVLPLSEDASSGYTSGNYNEPGNLTIASGGNLNLGSSLISVGALELQSGGTLTSTSGTLYITSEKNDGYALNLDGTFNNNSGTIEINTNDDTNLDLTPSSGEVYSLTIDLGSTGYEASILENTALGGSLIIDDGYLTDDNDYDLVIDGQVHIQNGGTLNISGCNDVNTVFNFGSLKLDSGGKILGYNGSAIPNYLNIKSETNGFAAEINGTLNNPNYIYLKIQTNSDTNLIISPEAGELFDLYIDHPSSTITSTLQSAVTNAKYVEIAEGVLDTNNNAVTISYDLDIDSGGTFDANGDTVDHSCRMLHVASGGTYIGSSASDITVTGESGGYAIDLDGTYTANNNEIIITTNADTNLDLTPSSGNVYDVKINLGTSSRRATLQQDVTIDNQLWIMRGILDTNNHQLNAGHVVIGDEATNRDGTLDCNGDTVEHSFESLYLTQNGTFIGSPNNILHVTSYYILDYTAELDGNYTANGNTLELNTNAADKNLIVNLLAGSLHNLTINLSDSSYDSNLNNNIDLTGNLTVIKGILDTNNKMVNVTYNTSIQSNGRIDVKNDFTTNNIDIDSNGILNIDNDASFTTSGILTLDANGNFKIINGSAININLSGTKFNLTNANNIQLHTTPSNPPNPTNWYNISKFVNITDIGASPSVDINVTYSDSDLGDVTESTLVIKGYNWSTGSWTTVSDTGVNTDSNYVWGNSITSFSVFAPLGQILSAPTVVTNASTNVEDTSATMHGYLQSNGSLDTTCGLRYGTTSGSYTENVSKGVLPSNTEFSNTNGSLTSGDLYYFQAWASNSEGFANGSELKFFTEPPPTTNLAESGSTSTSISYTWTKPSVGAGATAYTRIQYKTTGYPTTINDGTNTYNSTGTTDSTTGLTPGTHYYFSAFSWAEEGGIGRWNDTYDTMDAWTNPGDPTSISSTQGSNWINITFNHGTNGEYTMIRRNATGVADYPADRNSGILVANTTNNYANDTGLSPSTTYYYSLWTWDTDGKKWCINKVTYSTSTSGANPIVITNDATGVEETNATLQGYLQNDGGESCTVRFEYGTTTSYGTNTSNQTKTSEQSFSASISGLTSGDLYHYRAYANNTVGSDTGDDKTFFTKPQPPTNLAETSSTSTSLSYNWTKATVGAGATAYTRIQYKTTGYPTTINDGTNTYNNTGTTDSTTGLTPGTHYYFSAWTWGTEGGIGAWSDNYDTMDAWTNPGDPTSISSTQGSNWINITFNHGTNGEYTMIRRNATGVADYPADRNSGILVANTTNSFANDTGLSPSTTYYYSLWTWDTDGKKWCINRVTYSTNTSSPANNAPTVDDKTPTNGSTNVDVCSGSSSFVICQAYANDTDGDTLTVTWATNESGVWTNVHTNNSVPANTIVSYNYTQFNNYSTTYWWRVYVDDGTENISETYRFTTNYAPTESGETPTNESVNISTTPALHVICTDTDSDTMTAYWYSNSSGTWQQFAINNSISSGTNITQTNNNFTGSKTKYWWSVNLTDGCTWTNNTYHFTTTDIYAPTITWEPPTPTDGDTQTETYVHLNTTITDQSQTSAFFDWNNSLIGYWSFEYYNSTHVFDNSTYQNNGSYGGGLGSSNITTGKYGNGLEFNESQYVDCGAEGHLNDDMTAVTVEGWMYAESVPSSGEGLFSKTNLNYGCTYYTNGYVYAYIRSGSNYASTSVTTGEWHHIVETFNGTTIKLYVDGDLKASKTSSYSSTGTGGTFRIGRSYSGMFNGTIDEVRVYNRALSWEEINASYNNSVHRLQHNFTGLSDGTYNYSAYAIDTYGNLNITTTRTITISTNIAPWQHNEGPNNGSTNQCPPVTLNVTCTDNNTDTMTATWWSNSSGSWVQFASNNSITSGENIIQTNNNFTNMGTTYYWSVNLTDGTLWNNQTYHFTTNYAPTQTNEEPNNNNVSEPPNVPLNITINDQDGDTMTAYWRSNSSGTWVTFATNTSGNGTITQTNNNFSNPGTTYYWSVNLTDGCTWNNQTYSFTTHQAPTQTNENPSNNTDALCHTSITILNVTIEDPEGANMNWSIETSPNIGSNSSNGASNGSIECNVSGLQPGTTYTWYVNVTDGDFWTNNTYTFTTSYTPTQTGEAPTNGKTGVPTNPYLHVIVNDQDTSDTLTVYWRSNSSGSWTTFATNTTVTPGTNISQQNTNFSTYGKKYWWSVNVTDGCTWNNQTYSLTIIMPIVLSNENPTNGSTGVALNPILTIQANHTYGHQMNITWYWGTTSACPNQIGSNTSITNGTYQQNNDNNFSSNDQTYYWKLVVNDGHGAWLNVTYHFTTIGHNKVVVGKTTNAYSLEIHPDGNVLYGYINGNSVSTSIDTNWHYVTLTYDGVKMRLYVDGELKNTQNLTENINTNNNSLVLGDYLTGTLDEVRISNSARSSAWINTTYQNTYSPTTFVTFGEQRGVLTTWTYRKQIWINASLVDSDLTNFPVLIKTTDTDLKNHALSNGYDIMFMNNSVNWRTGSYTQKLNHEIEKYDNTTGELVAWVKIPSVSSTTNTSIYMYYGNSLCTADRQNPTGVWDNNYVMVQHLEETSGVHYDSTSNNNDGNQSGGVNQSASDEKINGADWFDGNNDYINCGNASSLDITNSISFEAWIKAADTQSEAAAGIISKDDVGTGRSYNFHLSSATSPNAWSIRMRLLGLSGNDTVDGTTDLADNNWHYVAGTWDGSTLRIYVDGEEENNKSGTGSITTTSTDVHIGDFPGDIYRYKGTIDEVRISNTARSSSWIKATYNNVNDTNHFIEFGPQETQNVAPTQSNPVPSNGATYQNLNPTLYITVNDTNADSMNVTFRTNASGTWQDIGSNNTVYNGTYSQTPTNMNQWGTKYWWSVNVTDGDLWCNQTYNFTTKTFNYVIYYFDGYDTSEAWPNNPENMVDGVNTTFANCQVGTHVQLLNNNTCPGTNLGTIEKVEIRCYGNDSDDVQATYLRPVFNGTTDGNNYTMDISPEKWSNWTDITNDPNAPSSWTWDDIVNLDCDVEAYNVGTFGNDYVGIVQIRVNYSTSPYLYTMNKGIYKKLTDFIPGATSKEKEYTQHIDITNKVEITNNSLKLKITEEIDNETTYLDRIYLKVNGNKTVEINKVSKLSSIPHNDDILHLNSIKQLLRESDNKYLTMNKGDGYQLEFIIPDNYCRIEFCAEGYYKIT